MKIIRLKYQSSPIETSKVPPSHVKAEREEIII